MISLLTRKYKRIILYLELSMMVLLFLFVYNFIPIEKGNKTFYIPSSKPKEMIDALQKNGYKITAFDKIILQFTTFPTKGWYTLKEDHSGRYSFFMNLHTMKTERMMHIRVYAGETKKELTHRLANDMKLNEQVLLKNYEVLAHFKEADILAQNYTIARDADENTTIQYLFDQTSIKLEFILNKYFSKPYSIKKLKKALTIASIIQKESNSILEMPIISSVIHNRLAKNMYLQMDATLNYGPYAHTIIKRKRIKNDTSLYNTYKHKGLPPSPLCTVTYEAIEAALTPQENDYLFFMLTKKGIHAFSTTYKEHLENVSLFRAHKKKQKQTQENNESNESNHSQIKISSSKDTTL